MRKALIITTDNFPNGNAGAIRQETLAKLMVLNGYDVDVLGYGPSTNFEFKRLNDHVRFLSYRSDSNGLISKVFDRLMFRLRAKRYIKKTVQYYNAILFVSIPLRLIEDIKNICKTRDIVLIHDSVEWYSPSEFILGRMSPFYIEKNLLNLKLVNKSIRVIGISTFLTDYFKSKGCAVERIPFICDTNENINKKRSNKISFVYAGQMGKKDHARAFLEAVSLLNPTMQNRIKIDIIGPSYDEMKKYGQISDELFGKIKHCLKVHGRVKREIVTQYLASADFTFLFRNAEERYAKAGFPTKVVESLCMSTPVLCNLSSDLDMYLVDGENSVISKSEKTEDILDCLKRIISMSEAELLQMQKNARELACNSFDYHLFKYEMKNLLGVKQ